MKVTNAIERHACRFLFLQQDMFFALSRLSETYLKVVYRQIATVSNCQLFYRYLKTLFHIIHDIYSSSVCFYYLPVLAGVGGGSGFFTSGVPSSASPSDSEDVASSSETIRILQGVEGGSKPRLG